MNVKSVVNPSDSMVSIKTTCEFTEVQKFAHCEKMIMQRQHLVVHVRSERIIIL